MPSGKSQSPNKYQNKAYEFSSNQDFESTEQIPKLKSIDEDDLLLNNVNSSKQSKYSSTRRDTGGTTEHSSSAYC